MRRIEITVDDADADRLKLEADQLGISRSDLLRDRVTRTPVKTDKLFSPLSTTAWWNALAAGRVREWTGVRSKASLRLFSVNWLVKRLVRLLIRKRGHTPLGE